MQKDQKRRTNKRILVVTPGDKIGKLTVINEASPIIDRRGTPSRMVDCVCDCGNETTIFIGHLYNTKKKITNISCDCIRDEGLRRRSSTHKLSYHPLYSIWRQIINRTKDNPKCKHYPIYYAVGVRICPEWNDDFIPFYNWAIDKWKPGLQIDKDIIYFEKHGKLPGLLYSPEYCSFVTAKKNSSNRTTSHLYKYNGENLTLTEISENVNMNIGTLYCRINDLGMRLEEAIQHIDYRFKDKDHYIRKEI